MPLPKRHSAELSHHVCVARGRASHARAARPSTIMLDMTCQHAHVDQHEALSAADVQASACHAREGTSSIVLVTSEEPR